MVDDARLPEDIERGARGGPGFKTTVSTLISGHEQRNIDWQKARGNWNVAYGIRNKVDLQAVIDFFYERRGRAYAFRFKDWSDFQAVAVSVAPVTGQNLQRQLVKRYGTGTREYIRNITHPIVSTVKVYIDNLETDNYTLSDNGLLIFPTNPGVNVKASFNFDIPVRFDVDVLEIQMENFNAGFMPSVPVVEVRI